MVYNAVSAHRGSIEVRSEPGIGSTFSLYVPIQDDGAPAVLVEDETLVSGTGCILVADDDETVRRVAIRMLTRLGYHVEAAEDGNDAVGIVRRAPERFSLVILDGDMPRMAGRAAAAQLKEIAPRLPLLLATGEAEGDPSRLAAAGFRGVLTKPFSIAALSRVVSLYAQQADRAPRTDQGEASLYGE
jgi:CheY-like chemotaxis protein